MSDEEQSEVAAETRADITRFALTPLGALRFGVSRTLENASLWLVFSVCLVLVLLAAFVVGVSLAFSTYDPAGIEPSAGETNIWWLVVLGVFPGIISVAITVVFGNAALREAQDLAPRLHTLHSATSFAPAIGVACVRYAIFAMLQLAVLAFNGLNTIALTQLAILVIWILAEPVLGYSIYFALEGKYGFIGSLVRGWKFGMAHYLILLQYGILAVLALYIAALPCYLGLIIVLPAAMIGHARLYKVLA
ncbi:hypothetical protein [Corynebacterium freiburgense]|uniref:hypothetical protein n=1 Tax=Corynebacterium freiburgense TaxID=556548 RepID=UPI0003FB6B36|nr:hypothetical protein [Corynebacterium freiburgense]WJZ02882.1 hypothetical protein CFREI_08020 [Corynebacterium freiburgense]